MKFVEKSLADITGAANFCTSGEFLHQLLNSLVVAYVFNFQSIQKELCFVSL